MIRVVVIFIFEGLAFLRVVIFLSVFLFSSASAEGVESRTFPMDFERCLEKIRSFADQLGVAPINLVETNILRMVRFLASDGSVLVTCSQLDRKMTVTRSPYQ